MMIARCLSASLLQREYVDYFVMAIRLCSSNRTSKAYSVAVSPGNDKGGKYERTFHYEKMCLRKQGIVNPIFKNVETARVHILHTFFLLSKVLPVFIFAK